jgi:lipoyl-dependent peroxiredoxin
VPIREAQILWEGPLVSGTGTLSSTSGALEQLAVSWASRMGEADGRTSPEELIAAAYASCFAMALAFVLDDNQTPPQRLTVRATCALSSASGAPRITTVELSVRAQIPGLDKAGFEHNMGRAADLCPVCVASSSSDLPASGSDCRRWRGGGRSAPGLA